MPKEFGAVPWGQHILIITKCQSVEEALFYVNKVIEEGWSRRGLEDELPTNPLLADPMYWNGYIEKVGTGTEDIIEKCHAYGLQTPEFHQEEDFRVVIWRRKNDNADLNVKDFTPYVTPYDTPYDTPCDTPYDISKVKVLLGVLKDRVMSRKELMERLQLKDIKNFNLLYLQPALSLGLIEMTIPDKPKSKKQQYRLTEKGFSIK